MGTTNDREKNYTLYEGFVLPFSLIVTICCMLGILITIGIYIYQGNIDPSEYINATLIGTFGDFIGGFFGTWFSLVTVFLVWLAYQSQKNELKVLGEQGKEQTKIQALAALISCETELLSMYNLNWQEAREGGNFPYVADQREKMDNSITKINTYKKQLSDILEKHNTIPPTTIVITRKKKNKFIRLVKYYFKYFWRLLFLPF